MGNKVIKSIGFNITNPNDVETLKHIAKKRNFSGYVKKLIAQDILQGQARKDPENANLSVPGPSEKMPIKLIPKEPTSASNRLENFKSILNQPKRQSDNQQQPPRFPT